jgi:hypothetical protein
VKKTGGFTSSGLDRLDSNLGHTYSNVVACCKRCNWAKRTMSVDEFYAWKACIKATIGHLSIAQITEMAGIATSHLREYVLDYTI